MIITDLTTIDRLAEEACGYNPIYSFDLADYANLKQASDYIKAAKLETPSLSKECSDKLSQLIQEMGTDNMKEIIFHITCNGSYSDDVTTKGIIELLVQIHNINPNACLMNSVSSKDSDESGYAILLLVGYTQK